MLHSGSEKEPILAVIGADVRLFSDLAGVHFVKLDEAGGKRNLFERLNRLVGPLNPVISDWETSAQAGEFTRCKRPRWRFFDEVHEMMRYFKNRRVRAKKHTVSLLEIVQRIVAAEPERDWSRVDARDFIEAVKAAFGQSAADTAYWWFIVYGFFRFGNIECWGITEDATWDDSVDEALLSPRGSGPFWTALRLSLDKNQQKYFLGTPVS